MAFPQTIARLSSYLKPGDSYHFSREIVPAQPPSFEHSHDFYELFLVQAGTVNHSVNGVQECLQTGHLVFVRPQDRHALHATDGTRAQTLNVAFPVAIADHLGSRYCEDFTDRFFWCREPLPVAVWLNGAQFERAVNTMLTLDSQHRSRVRIEHFLLSVMTHVLDATQVVEDRAPPWLISACRMARDPSVLRDGVERFVALAGRSHAHVCRQTQRYFGLSPTQFINRVRIQHAAMLLGKTDRKVQDIAETCGFENMSYFHRQFRQQYGTTPRAFRGNHRRADGD